MSRLLTSLYLDEDVDVLVATLLRRRGFEETTTQEAGRLGATDAEQLGYAARDGMAILTHNRSDFEALSARYRAERCKHHGIIIAVQDLPPHAIVRRLMAIVDRLTADEVEDQLLYV